jgi:hypothetical protein
MKVTVATTAAVNKPIRTDYEIDPRYGVPAVGEELVLRERDYHDKDSEFRMIAVVIQRRWIFSQNKPAEPELRLIVEPSQDK